MMMMMKNHHDDDDDSNILKLLLVGEGDFSASLAILRAYHHDPPPSVLPVVSSTSSSSSTPSSLLSSQHSNLRVVVVMSTVLTSAKELYETYPDTAFQNLQEIYNIIYKNDLRLQLLPHDDANKDTSISKEIDDIVLYNVDACQLHTTATKQRLRQRLQYRLNLESGGGVSDDNVPGIEVNDEDTKLFDMVIFQYPHLGIPIVKNTTNEPVTSQSKDDNESILRQRHISLLHHYLYSASFLASSVNVTLNVSQYHSWIALPQQQQQLLTEQKHMGHTNTYITTPLLSLSLNDSKNDTILPPNVHLRLQKIVPVQQPFHYIFPKTTDCSTATDTSVNLNPGSYNKHPTSNMTETSMNTIQYLIPSPSSPWSSTRNRTDDTTTITSTTTKRRVSKKYDGGSHRHHLTKYGYHHVRTITTTTTTTCQNGTNTTTTTTPPSGIHKKKKIAPVSLLGSCHYVFERVQQQDGIGDVTPQHNHVECETNDVTHGMFDHHSGGSTSCPICCVTCSNTTEYQIHCHSPTIYPIMNYIHSTVNGCSEMVDTIFVNGNEPIIHGSIDKDSRTEIDDTTGSIRAAVPIDKDSQVVDAARSAKGNGTSTFPSKDGVSRTSVKLINTNTLMKNKRNAVIEAIVSIEHVGKRLRWFLQHGINNGCKNDSSQGIHLSKRQSERLIQNGGTSINDEVVTDSSRILHDMGWVVRVDLQKQHEQVTCTGTNEKDNSSDNYLETSHTTKATTDDVDDLSKVTSKVTIVQTYLLQNANVTSRKNSMSLLVVWKPVGMRTIGSFTNTTLEQYLYHHHQPPMSQYDGLNTNVSALPMLQYISLSKLDKGCSGLCVVVQQCQQSVESSTTLAKKLCIRIQHTFTALIYSRNCPEEWKTGATVLFPVHKLRRWKSHKRQCQRPMAKNRNDFVDVDSPSHVDQQDSMRNVHEDQNEVDCYADEDDIDQDEVSLSHTSSNTDEMEATITVIEQTQFKGETTASNPVPALATISIATSSTVSGLAQTIGYYLRCNGCSIVGDRMAVQEYNALPRAVRNRIKQRLCLGCTGVCLKVKMNRNNSSMQEQCFETNHSIPMNWSALYWQEFCSHSSAHDG